MNNDYCPIAAVETNISLSEKKNPEKPHSALCFSVLRTQGAILTSLEPEFVP